jgi:hypothetical protein
MNIRRWPLGLVVAAVTAGGAAMASPAWAAPADEQACHLTAYKPEPRPGSALQGTGLRSGCGDQVTYFWVRVYRDIDLWPDAERAVIGSQYVQNDELTARGKCGDHGEHYTHTSTATGLSGDSVESARKTLC